MDNEAALHELLGIISTFHPEPLTPAARSKLQDYVARQVESRRQLLEEVRYYANRTITPVGREVRDMIERSGLL